MLEGYHVSLGPTWLWPFKVEKKLRHEVSPLKTTSPANVHAKEFKVLTHWTWLQLLWTCERADAEDNIPGVGTPCYTLHPLKRQKLTATVHTIKLLQQSWIELIHGYNE